MKDGRCWQAEMGRRRTLSRTRVRDDAVALARGPVDAARLWPDDGDDRELATLGTLGVREAFVEIVREDRDLRRSWAEHLGAHATCILGGIGHDPGFAREISAEAMQGALSRWLQQKSAARAWDDASRRLDYVPDVLGFSYANLLLEIDPAAAAVAFEALKLPTFIHQAMQWGQELSQDKEALLAVLDGAAPVFDDRRWTRNIVALIALELALDHALQIDEALRRLAFDNPWRDAMPSEAEAAHAGAVAKLRQEEVPAWFRLAFERVLARSDGREILLLLCPFVNRRVLRARQVELGQPRWEPYAIARRELAAVLAREGIACDELRQRWKAECEEAKPDPKGRRTARGERAIPVGEGARTLHMDGVVHLMGALSMLSGASPEAEFEATWNWFVELLRGRDPGLEFLENAAGGERLVQELGSTLAGCSDPLASFAGSYRLLEPQRRRAQHAYRYEEYRSNEESAVLLRTALYAAAVLRGVNDPASARRAESLFTELYAQARRLWLTVGWGDQDRPEDVVALCFAFVPAIFGAKSAAMIPALVGSIASEPGLCLRAARFLWLNHMPVDSIVALFRPAGVDLGKAAVEERQWWGEARGRPAWFEGVEAFVRCLEPEEMERRRTAIRARALERWRDVHIRGRDALEDWLAAERDVAVDERRRGQGGAGG